MTARLVGVNGTRALFSLKKTGVVVNTVSLAAQAVDLEREKKIRPWTEPADTSRLSQWAEVAESAVQIQEPTEITVTASGTETRGFTVPKLAAKSADTALRNTRALTPLSQHVATVLSSGKQVTLRDVQFVNRFHKFNNDTSPYSGAWGGPAAARWASLIVERHARAIAAAGDAEVNLLAFYEGDDTERSFWAVRPEAESEHVVGLLKRTPEDTWLTWGNGDWLEAEGNPAEDALVELDDDTAIYVAGALYDAPDTPVSLRDPNPEEWDMCEEAKAGIDWDMVDRVMQSEALRAAGPLPQPGDRQYTPEERSKNAQQQIRDANGKFATVGRAGTMKSGTRATIVKVNSADGSLIVKDEQGNHYPVPAKDFTMDDLNEPQQHTPLTPPANGTTVPKLNLDGILGQPRAVGTTPKAMLPHVLQPMGAAQITKVISDYGDFIERERRDRAKDFRGGTGWPVRAGAVEETDTEFALDEKPTPETTDVAPLHLAIVDQDDPRAVTDLIELVPAASAGSEVTTFKRSGGSWVEDATILQDLRSPTPPPVVKLDDATYQNVLAQVDSAAPVTEEETPAAPATPASTETPAAPAVAASIDFNPACIFGWDENGDLCAVVAAGEGGLDRNRGNAEKLRRYWLYGPGAAKIRWGTGGDWYRCVRQLSKYLGVRAKGYCALRHHEATGEWTAEHAKALRSSGWVGDTFGEQRYKHDPSERAIPLSSRDDIRSIEAILTASADEARRLSVMSRVYGPGGADVPVDVEAINEGRIGRAFKIPLVIPEGLESGDGRTFERGSLSMRSFPLPLLWQLKTGEGHDGSFLVGRIDRVERTEDGLGNAHGYFDTGPYGEEAQRLVENGMLRWVSADLDRFEGEEEELSELDDDKTLKTRKMRIKKGRLMGVTLVPKPAFQECTIELTPLEEVVAVPDGVYEDETAEVVPITASAAAAPAQAVTASVTIAERIPVEPPAEWFDRPNLKGPTPITVTDDGQVFGHIATWAQAHIGRPDVLSAPRSATNYSYFHTGVIRTSAGSDVPVGQLTLAGGHAGPYDDVTAAVKHYDDTGSAVADVHVGEDAHGIWAAGALRPGTSPEQIRALRASAPSGDWRPVNGKLELVAVCQVNVPGFPVPRVCVASGALTSLVAAGSKELLELSAVDHLETVPVNKLQARIARLERYENEKLDSLAASARERVFKVLDVDGYLTEFKDFSPERREKLAKEKKALKDGSFPIENAADLRRAIHAYGRADDAKKASVRRHIVRRAQALEKTDILPKDWKEAALDPMTLTADDAREVLTAAALARRVEKIQSRVKPK